MEDRSHSEGINPRRDRPPTRSRDQCRFTARKMMPQMRSGDANISPVSRSPVSSSQRTKMTAPVHNKAVPAMVWRFSRLGAACGAEDAGADSVSGASSPCTSWSSVTPKSSESFMSFSSSGIEVSVSHLEMLWREMPSASARSPCDQSFCVRRRAIFSPSVMGGSSFADFLCSVYQMGHEKSTKQG